jgi:hypothetical protein
MGGLIVLIGFYLLFSQSWKRILHWLSVAALPISSLRQSRIFFASFITRYLPAGKIINIGTRIELLNQEGGNRVLGAESLFFEQVYFIGTTILLGWLAFLISPLPNLTYQFGLLDFSILILGLVFGILLVVGPGKILVEVINRLNLSDYSLSSDLPLANRIEMVLRFTIVNILQGLSATLILWSVYPSLNLNKVPLVWLVAAYPLSRLIGQIMTVMPGGLGIREGMYVLILGIFLPIQPLVVGAAMMRLVSVLIEGIILLVLSLSIRFRETRVPIAPLHQE